MIWPFKRREKPAPPAEERDTYDRAAENLIAQGIPPEKVYRATRMLKRYARDGLLPEGVVRTPDD